jgi:hypothetical protein
MFGIKNDEQCDECQKANRLASYTGLAGGLLLGVAATYFVIKYANRR